MAPQHPHSSQARSDKRESPYNTADSVASSARACVLQARLEIAIPKGWVALAAPAEFCDCSGVGRGLLVDLQLPHVI